MASSGISDVMTASRQYTTEKTCLKKLMMMMIIIIMNKSHETTVFGTGARNWLLLWN